VLPLLPPSPLLLLLDALLRLTNDAPDSQALASQLLLLACTHYTQPPQLLLLLVAPAATQLQLCLGWLACMLRPCLLVPPASSSSVHNSTSTVQLALGG
jgi:hypothetical protein